MGRQDDNQETGQEAETDFAVPAPETQPQHFSILITNGIGSRAGFKVRNDKQK